MANLVFLASAIGVCALTLVHVFTFIFQFGVVKNILIEARDSFESRINIDHGDISRRMIFSVLCQIYGGRVLPQYKRVMVVGILVNALLLIYLAIPGSVGNSFLLESQINVRLITFLVISVIVNEIFTVTLTKYFSWLSVRHSSFYPIVIDILFLIGCIYVLPVIYFLGVSEKFLSIDLGYVREGFETTELNDILIVLQIMWSDFAQLLYVFTPVIN